MLTAISSDSTTTNLSPGALAERYGDGRMTAALLRQPGDGAEGRIAALTRRSRVARFKAV